MPFDSTITPGRWFWCHTHDYGSGYVTVNFSNQPHTKLPHYCAEHDWYTDYPCDAH